ncbi:Carboxypeptidase regulatory-like domain-containing protein [Duganella sacchari]|uniref:Carboxypeptidase regulatory-like domain-containing protein n=1 Tax=Duganella sacchari TaxID=551987 RepID=A0A1M7HGM0_9BURK|nr:carboxypeptidase-like regulatory domain-containing protein [Duganella sacchari]SHM27317.1 Carboxypeptidase regulatory-like domain-containing protein [Duganella sacchari]
MKKLIFAALFALTNFALAADNTGSIAGAADAGAQIVVTNLETGEITGIMAKCDGSYRAEGLKPGRYQIIEGGPHHAAREVGVSAGKESQVDLAPASKASKCKPHD